MRAPLLPGPWADLIDVALVAALLYALIVLLRGARAHLALVGIGVLALVYLIAEQLGLTLTASIFQAFFAVFLILLVVVFQAEIRQMFERIALVGLRQRGPAPAGEDALDVLVRSVAHLADERHGALIVVPGADPLERHIQGGIPLSGKLSEPLLLSIFDPGSAGHDGAVVLDGDRVRLFATHLPLSRDRSQLRMRGTRHAAALGLAERTDSLCIVVSEETGRISLAEGGRLVAVPSTSQLASRLEAFARRGAGAGPTWIPLGALRQSWRELAIAVGLSALLWGLVVPGSEVAERTLPIPVRVTNLPEGWALQGVEPPQVDATVEGLRRDLLFLDARELEVVIDAYLVQLGRRTFEISSQSVEHPSGLHVTGVSPTKLRLSVRNVAAAGEPARAGGTP